MLQRPLTPADRSPVAAKRLDPRVASFLKAAEKALADQGSGSYKEAEGFEKLAEDAANKICSAPSVNHAAISARKGIRLLEIGEPEQALQLLTRALDMRQQLGLEDKNDFDLLYSCGVAARQANKLELSEQHLKQALDLAERKFDHSFLPAINARVALAYALAKANRYDESIAVLEKAKLACSADPKYQKMVDEAFNIVNERSNREASANGSTTTQPLSKSQRNEQLAEELEVIHGPEEEETPDKVLDELEADLIGLDEIKKQFRRLANLLRVQSRRKEIGIKAGDRRFHVLMIGPPGTGKTTVASYLGRICRSLGLLQSADVVVATRSSLVRGHVGQTGPRTNEVIDFALDRVLFIDEAYSLAPPESGNDFGPEAIAELMVRMERDADRLVVAAAGYPEEMSTFLESNSGFASRFTDTLEFDHYEADELEEIFALLCEKNEYQLADDARPALKKWCEEAVAERDDTFGNGRAMRNLFEAAISHQADRIIADDQLHDDQALVVLKASDIEAVKPSDHDFTDEQVAPHQAPQPQAQTMTEQATE